MQDVTIIGVGRVGGALALSLSRRGFAIKGLVVRSPGDEPLIATSIWPHPKIIQFDHLAGIDSSLIVIATQDRKLAEVVQSLSKCDLNGVTILHLSGALSSDALSVLRKSGASVGSLHPLVSISDPGIGAERLRNAKFCVEGDASAVLKANEIVKALEGESFSIETRMKPLYHAAAVTACGHFVALLDASFEMLARCGLDEDTARRMFLPLVRSTVDNITVQNLPDALTGPFARGDAETFVSHLEALRQNVADDVTEIYLSLAARSLTLAARRGTVSEERTELAEKISLAKKNLKC